MKMLLMIDYTMFSLISCSKIGCLKRINKVFTDKCVLGSSEQETESIC